MIKMRQAGDRLMAIRDAIRARGFGDLAPIGSQHPGPPSPGGGGAVSRGGGSMSERDDHRWSIQVVAEVIGYGVLVVGAVAAFFYTAHYVGWFLLFAAAARPSRVFRNESALVFAPSRWRCWFHHLRLPRDRAHLA
jgi:hypothetical protein